MDSSLSYSLVKRFQLVVHWSVAATDLESHFFMVVERRSASFILQMIFPSKVKVVIPVVSLKCARKT